MTTTPADGNEPNRPPKDGPLAPTAPGQPTRPHLTRAHKILIAAVATGMVTIAGIGFAGSYAAVTHLAIDKGFGDFAYWFTIGIDSGIGVLLALDLLLTWLRIGYPLLRQGAWLLTAATICFNAAAAWPDPIGVAMHAVIPLLFVITVEAARHAIGRIADITADKHIDGVPLARWLVDPLGSFRIWRRMRLWNIRSYTTAINLQREVRIYRAQLRREYGRLWKWKATADKKLVLELAANGMSITEAIALPEAEARKQAEAEAKRNAEAEARALAEAEAKHEAELRKTEAEAKRRAELAKAKQAETEAELEAEAKRIREAEAARLLVAETEAKLAAIALEQRQAEAEAEAKHRAQAAELARKEAEAKRAQQEAEQAKARSEQQERDRAETERRQAEARERALRITSEAATRTASVSGLGSDGTSGSGPKRTTSVSGSSASLGGARAKKQAEVAEVLARITEANNPEAVSQKWVMEHFGLKPSAAYDRLVTARELWRATEAQTKTG